VRAEIGKILAVEVGEQVVGSGLRRGEGPALVGLIEFGVGSVLEDVAHVAEGLERGDQIHVALRRVGIELSHRLGIEGRSVGTDLRMSSKAKGVLGVEHQDVQLEPYAQIDHLFQALRRRDFAPGDVEHQSPETEIRCVFDLAGRDAPTRAHQLGEGLHGVAKARRPGGDRLDVLRCHADPVGLSLLPFAPQLDPGPQSAGAGVSLDRKVEAADPPQRVAQGTRGGEIRIRGARRQYHRQSVAERKGSRGGANAGGSRQQGRPQSARGEG